MDAAITPTASCFLSCDHNVAFIQNTFLASAKSGLNQHNVVFVEDCLVRQYRSQMALNWFANGCSNINPVWRLLLSSHLHTVSKCSFEIYTLSFTHVDDENRLSRKQMEAHFSTFQREQIYLLASLKKKEEKNTCFLTYEVGCYSQQSDYLTYYGLGCLL